MRGKLTDIQRLILLSADERGRIPFEEADTEHFARLLHTLVRTHGGEYFRRANRDGYFLTQAGRKALKAMLAPAQRNNP